MVSHSALVLFDMSNFIHRSFHSLPVDNFRRDDGLATNAVFGTAKIILGILAEFERKYNHIYPIACFDTAKSKLSRMNIDPNYKAQRPSAPNELKHQFEWVRELVQSMNIPQMETETHEADDVIASLCHQNKNKYSEVIIVSTDKDFNQCIIQENILIYNTAKKIFQTSKDIYEKYNVTPSNFQLYQALVGDKIDNVPGVKGIGPKVAPAIVHQANGSLETLLTLAHDGTIVKNKSKLILDNIQNLQNSFDLVKLDTDLKTDCVTFQKFTIKSLKKKLEFANFIDIMNFNASLLQHVVQKVCMLCIHKQKAVCYALKNIHKQENVN